MEVKKDKRSNGCFYHKVPYGTICDKNHEIKLLASKDITQECGESKFYTQNYLQKEYLIMQVSNIDEILLK